MLKIPRCFERKCIHFKGVTWLGKQEKSEINFCNAFPEGISEDITYGDNLHLIPIKGQDNTIVFEKILELLEV